MGSVRKVPAACLLSFGLLTHQAFAADYVKIQSKTKRGGEFSVALSAPDNPRASLLLLVGGDGNLEFKYFPTSQLGYFVNRGIAVAAVDVPSTMRGINSLFRISNGHAADLSQVLALLRKRWGLPVWVLGHSAGCLSAANIASAAPDLISGLILSACVTNPKKEPNKRGVQDLPVHQVTVPAFILAHESDGCDVTPPSGVTLIAEALSSSPRVETKFFRSGDGSGRDLCGGKAHHSYYGIEADVYSAIVGFIDSAKEPRAQTR